MTPGTRFMTNSAATVALGCPTSFGLEDPQMIHPHIQHRRHAPEQELSIEITYINGIHIYNMYILESQECEVG